MRILIIGGTIFLGRHLAEAALAAGHEVAFFNRGRHNPDLFPEAEKIRGDRTKPEDVAALEAAGTWDAVVDTCGYFPKDVRLTAGALADRAGLSCFISSVSASGDRNGGGGAAPGPTPPPPRRRPPTPKPTR